MKRNFLIMLIIASITIMSMLSACSKSENKEDISEKVEISDSEILEISPIDKNQEKYISDLKQYSNKDTWAVYIYMCGSDLESGGKDNLTELTKMIASKEKESYKKELDEKIQGQVLKFVEEIDKKKMKLPKKLYKNPEVIESEFLNGENEEQQEPQEEEMPSSATKDLEELISVKLPENIKFVIQTGGATAWSNPQINPNRSQRFVYDSTGFYEVQDNQVMNMGSKETLEDFLLYCDKNHSADHKICIFWNHGLGSFGYATDEMYNNDTLSLREMKEAFSEVYNIDEKNPPFELIGFDACLMGSFEVANTLHGISKYMVASEELEPGNGWDYGKWVQKFAENPAMNGAQIGKEICDSYIKTTTEDTRAMGYEFNCTMSVTDLSKARELYNAYEEFAKEALKASIEDYSYLAFIGQGASRTIRYSQEFYKMQNTIDLGMFMDNVEDLFPSSAKKVKDLLKDTAIYCRNMTYSTGSQGLSVYFPTYMEDFLGLNQYLEYIENISESKAISALYYYKIAGSLNDKYQEYADSLGLGKAKSIDTEIMKELYNTPLSIGENNQVSLKLSDGMMNLIQNVTVSMAKLDEKNNSIMYLGQDCFAYINEDNNLNMDLKPKWIGINGNLLYTEIVDVTDNYIKYNSPILYNDEQHNLIIAYDFNSEKIDILGLRKKEDEAAIIDRNLSELEEGAKITPLFKKGFLDNDKLVLDKGMTFTYKNEYKVEEFDLKDGDYLSFFEITDLRSDITPSQVVEFTVNKGNIEIKNNIEE